MSSFVLLNIQLKELNALKNKSELSPKMKEKV